MAMSTEGRGKPKGPTRPPSAAGAGERDAHPLVLLKAGTIDLEQYLERTVTQATAHVTWLPSRPATDDIQIP